MFEWNWADLIIAFIGFLSAIGAAFLTKKVMGCIQVRCIVKNLNKELTREVDDDFANRKKNLKNANGLNYRLLYFPYIESLRLSNKIELLSKEKWFQDLITLIVEVDELNDWVKAKTQFYIDNVMTCSDEQAKGEYSLQYTALFSHVKKKYKAVMHKVYTLKNSL